MEYYINPTAFSAVFTVPAVVREHLKLVRGDYVKVLLYIMANLSGGINSEEISVAVGLTEYETKEALLYWSQAGLLLAENRETAPIKEEKPKAVKQTEKPSRTDVAKRGAEDEKIRYLLQETQLKFGRNLKSNEASTLVWLYDDEGLDVSLILMIVQYAVSHGKANIRIIEGMAVDWINRGIDNVTAADEELRKAAIGEEAWGVVCSAFGIERRKPSNKETELSALWVNEWKMSREMLVAAYEACVNEKSRFYMPYVTKIIEVWHEKGYTTPDDIETNQKSGAKTEDYAAYDLDLFEKMLNKKD